MILRAGRGARLALAAIGLLLGTHPARAQRGDSSAFPHAKHERLFSTCAACHEGITAEGRPSYPPPTQCSGCHDGRDQKTVTWSGPNPTPTNLAFNHATHMKESPGDAAQCTACHAVSTAASTPFMAVARARPETCITCHSHTATAHLANDNRCSACHVPLTRATALTAQRIAAFPKPPSHDAPGFASAHAPTSNDDIARCATCHARESCARCHVNAASLAPVSALARDARVATLMVEKKPVSYPSPASHRSAEWRYAHGADARRAMSSNSGGIASCANCHARASCTVCHIGRGASDVIRKLPAPAKGEATGVQLEIQTRIAGGVGSSARTIAPVRVAAAPAPPADDSVRTLTGLHPSDFATHHAEAASARQLDCAGCHAQRYCTDCHAGEASTTRRRFHAANFVARHAPESYGRETECSSCHSPEVFCRGCHTNTGTASRGTTGIAFHTGQPLWLLQHGRAARQGMSSCTSCHKQRDCLQCHSQLGWSVNPHGPDFDAERMAKRNRQMCFTCHLSDPLRP